MKHNLTEFKMKCENCGKEVDINYAAYRNADTYNKIALHVSNCCGVAYNVIPIRHYELLLYKGQQTTDNWGNKITKPK